MRQFKMKSLLLIFALFCISSYANNQVNDTIITDSGKVINSYLVSVDGTKEIIGSVRYTGEHEWVEVLMNSTSTNSFIFDSMITVHTKDFVSERTYRTTNSINVYSFEIREKYKSVHTVNLNHKTLIMDDYTMRDRMIGKAVINSYNHNILEFQSNFNRDSGADVKYDAYVCRVFDDRIIEQYFMQNVIMTVIVTYTKPVSEFKEQNIKFKVRDDGSIDG